MARYFCPTFFAILTVIFVVTGVVLFLVLPGVVDNKIGEGLVITNDSEAMDRFLDPPADVKLFVYVFNVTNFDRIALNEKPVLQEIGPYVYTEKIVKENVEFNNDGITIEFDQKKVYEFDASASASYDTDLVYSLNFPLTLIIPGLAAVFGNDPETLKAFIEGKIASKELTREYTVKDLIFGTYKKMKTDEDEAFIVTLPPVAFIKNDSTYNSHFEVFTGKESISKLNVLYAYEKETKLSYWNDMFCDQLNGTDGSQFPPKVDKNKRLYIFSSDICRSLYFEYEKDSEIKGIPGLHFIVPREVYESPDKEPNNMCYCTKSVNKKDCPFGAGVLDLSSCQGGAPVFTSAPHFLDADKQYLNAVTGLHPNKTKHESIIDVHMDTGSVLNVNRKIQINVHVEPFEGLEQYVNISLMFPILWVNESAVINDAMTTNFTNRVLMPLKITKIIPFALIGLGAVFLIISVVLIIFMRRQR